MTKVKVELGGVGRSIGYAVESEAGKHLPAYLKGIYGIEITGKMLICQTFLRKLWVPAKYYSFPIWTDTRMRHYHRIEEGRVKEFTVQLEIAVILMQSEGDEAFNE